MPNQVAVDLMPQTRNGLKGEKRDMAEARDEVVAVRLETCQSTQVPPLTPFEILNDGIGDGPSLVFCLWL